MFPASSNVKIVVAIDLGTTFSGFAYARKSDPGSVFKCYDWPDAGKAGAKPYCKTQTSLFYVPGDDGKFHLKDWGWSALVQFAQSAQALRSTYPEAASDSSLSLNSLRLRDRYVSAESSTGRTPLCASNQPNYISDHIHLLNPPEWVTEKVGYLATKFKLFLAIQDGDQSGSATQKLPGDLTVERLIVDYLRCISGFVITELQLKYGKHLGKEDVQWCLTVPAIWDEGAKQVMKTCAQNAGLVKGPLCPMVDASPHPIEIVLEPEAASVYCQHQVRELNLRKGDELLVADVGGGTVDLVVHRKVDDDPRSLKLEEVVKSYGKLGGGSFVDTHFFNFMSGKIGCFKIFCRQNPSAALNILGWWQGIKIGFDGHGYSAEFSVPRKLSDAWESHDRSVGNVPAEDYSELRLNDFDIMRVFDREVEKALDLIERQITGVRVLMVVGGFAASPYFRRKILERFSATVEEIVIPEDPGGAICDGAVRLHLQQGVIQSRISKKTYGIRASAIWRPEDPAEYRYVDEEGQEACENRFCVFVRAGERIATNRSVTDRYGPKSSGQKRIRIDLYSSTESNPLYTTGKEAVKEGSFVIDISDGMEMGLRRLVDVTMRFGASSIEVTAKRVNFGSPNVEQSLSVTFGC